MIDNLSLTQRYVKVETAAHYIDFDPSFLEKRMGKDFIEGIHYFKPANCRATRWSLDALEIWIRTSGSSSSPENNFLVNLLTA